MNFGQLRNTAPELRVNDWIDADGKPMDKPLRLSDMKDGYKIIYCFQHWCPGCHSRGFPTLRFLHDKLKDKGFDFAVIQTVFEGAETNTRDKLRINQEQYGLKMPFGHDTPPAGERYPTFMEDYRSGGTPWFTVIDPEGNVVHADFRLDPQRFLAALGADDVELKRADHWLRRPDRRSQTINNEGRKMELVAEITHWVPAMKLLSLALAAIFVAFGIAKFARYEQDAVKTLVAGHPILRFGPKLMTPAGFSIFLGIVELSTALLLVLGIFSHILQVSR